MSLYDEIRERYEEKYARYSKTHTANITSYLDADAHAQAIGEMMAEAMSGADYMSPELVSAFEASLKDTYGMTAEAAVSAQKAMNSELKIGLKAVQPQLEGERVDAIVEKALAATSQEAMSTMLGESVPTFARQVVDDTQKANARLHSKAGLNVKVEREYDGVGLHNGTDVCEFCLERAGTWTYEKALDNGVFQRHEGCGCIITYTSAKGEVTIGTGAYLGGRDGEGKTTTGWKWETEEDYKNRTKIKDPQELENKILNMEYLKPAKDIIGAKKSLEKETGLEVGGYYDTVNLDFANKANSEIVRAFEIFGDLHGQGVLDGVRILKNPDAEYVAFYSPAMREINFLQHNVRYKNALAKMREEASLQFRAGAWSTSSEMHAVRHELGHAVAHTLSDEKRAEIEALRQSLVERLGITVDIKNPPRLDMAMAGTELSYYGLKDVDEFIAESIAEYMDRGARNVAKSVVDIILRR